MRAPRPRTQRSSTHASPSSRGARKKLPCRLAHRIVIGITIHTPSGCVRRRATSQAVTAKQPMPRSCGRSVNPPISMTPLASVSHAARLVAAPAARQARNTNERTRAPRSARSATRPNHPPSRKAVARTICASHCWLSQGSPYATAEKTFVRRTACVSNMMSPARRWYARSFTASGVPAITMTGIKIALAAQTCESRILARTAGSRDAPVGAWAITDVGPAIRRRHRQTMGVTEAAIPVLRRTSYEEPVEAGIPRPQARPLPYR